MVSVTSVSGYITSASHYHRRYHSRSLMNIRGLIPPNFSELAEAVPIAHLGCKLSSFAVSIADVFSYSFLVGLFIIFFRFFLK